MPALPSAVLPTMATMPEPTCFLPSSARLRRSLRSMPSTARREEFHVADRAHAVGRVGLAAAAHRELLLGLGQLALELAPLIHELRDARRQFFKRRLKFARPPRSARASPRWRAALRAALPVSASMRRTPAATPRRRRRPRSGRYRRCGAHACRRRARPTSRACCREPSPIATTRTSSPYFSPNSARAPEARRVVERHQPRRDRRVLQHEVVGDVLDLLDLLRVIGFGCEKSKRSRSGATSEPFCATWSPSTCAQRLVQQMRRGMVARGWRCGARDRRRAQSARRPSACPPPPCRCGRTDRRPSSACR